MTAPLAHLHRQQAKECGGLALWSPERDQSADAAGVMWNPERTECSGGHWSGTKGDPCWNVARAYLILRGRSACSGATSVRSRDVEYPTVVAVVSSADVENGHLDSLDVLFVDVQVIKFRLKY